MSNSNVQPISHTPGPLAEVRRGETRIYFAVPTCYTIGKTFPTYLEAADFARSTIETFKYGDGVPYGKSRAFVDVRIADEAGDRILYRFEVFEACITSARASENDGSLQHTPTTWVGNELVNRQVGGAE